jgi:hypothetical protein
MSNGNKKRWRQKERAHDNGLVSIMHLRLSVVCKEHQELWLLICSRVRLKLSAHPARLTRNHAEAHSAPPRARHRPLCNILLLVPLPLHELSPCRGLCTPTPTCTDVYEAVAKGSKFKLRVRDPGARRARVTTRMPVRGKGVGKGQHRDAQQPPSIPQVMYGHMI